MDTKSGCQQAVGREAAGRASIGCPVPRAGRRVWAGRRAVRAAGGPVVGALLALTVAACSGSDVASGSTGATTQPPSAGASATSGTVAPTTGAATATGAPAVRTCPSSSLAAKVQSAEGAAGTEYYEMALTNTGSTRCAVEGYPGASLLDAAGNQLGAPADREPAGQPPGAAGASGGRIALAPGGLLVFTVLITQPGVLPGCLTPDTMTKAATMRVYPPDNTVALLVSLNGTGGLLACAAPAVHELKVTTVGAV
ncbi:DUF4232 domain-containing protein [Pseudofrankia sp. DC12]|uniref:DUF4232 domain-containing protein n=1 Tax=Pseudofrankia sp. DC12 TaxID=683315 RepID=UPI000A0319D0|nr:DUF4232 domain-containing protein [Pseudofrankia sp. DC12]